MSPLPFSFPLQVQLAVLRLKLQVPLSCTHAGHKPCSNAGNLYLKGREMCHLVAFWFHFLTDFAECPRRMPRTPGTCESYFTEPQPWWKRYFSLSVKSCQNVSVYFSRKRKISLPMSTVAPLIIVSWDCSWLTSVCSYPLTVNVFPHPKTFGKFFWDLYSIRFEVVLGWTSNVIQWDLSQEAHFKSTKWERWWEVGGKEISFLLRKIAEK